MEIGMLWRDDSQHSLEEKVQRAVGYYRQKYGRVPNICFVNVQLLDDEIEVGAVRVCPAKYILPQHFWVGIQQVA